MLTQTNVRLTNRSRNVSDRHSHVEASSVLLAYPECSGSNRSALRRTTGRLQSSARLQQTLATRRIENCSFWLFTFDSNSERKNLFKFHELKSTKGFQSLLKLHDVLQLFFSLHNYFMSTFYRFFTNVLDVAFVNFFT